MLKHFSGVVDRLIFCKILDGHSQYFGFIVGSTDIFTCKSGGNSFSKDKYI